MFLGAYFLFKICVKPELFFDYEAFLKRKTHLDKMPKKIFQLLHKVRREVGFESFIDIIKSSNLYDKLQVLEKLKGEVTEKNVQLLKEATQDLLPEIRLFAAQSLLSMEDKLHAKIIQYKNEAESKGSCEDYAKLGDCYFTYANCGLLEKALSTHYLKLGVDAYRASLDEDSKKIEVMINYCRALVGLGEATKAKRMLDSALKIWPDQEDLIFLKAKVCFDLGLVEEVTKTLSNANESDYLDKKKSVISYWKN